jgi:hypothetical protein
MSVASSMDTNIPQSSAISIKDLRKLAIVNVDDTEKYRIRHWISTVSKVFAKVTLKWYLVQQEHSRPLLIASFILLMIG